MLYFAFGSNLDPDQMRARCPAHQVVGMAVLRDHKLIFPIFSTTGAAAWPACSCRTATTSGACCTS